MLLVAYRASHACIVGELIVSAHRWEFQGHFVAEALIHCACWAADRRHPGEQRVAVWKCRHSCAGVKAAVAHVAGIFCQHAAVRDAVGLCKMVHTLNHRLARLATPASPLVIIAISSLCRRLVTAWLSPAGVGTGLPDLAGAGMPATVCAVLLMVLATLQKRAAAGPPSTQDCLAYGPAFLRQHRPTEPCRGVAAAAVPALSGTLTVLNKAAPRSDLTAARRPMPAASRKLVVEHFQYARLLSGR